MRLANAPLKSDARKIADHLAMAAEHALAIEATLGEKRIFARKRG